MVKPRSLHPKGSAGLTSGAFYENIIIGTDKKPRPDILCFSVFDKQKDGNKQPMALSAIKGRFEF